MANKYMEITPRPLTWPGEEALRDSILKYINTYGTTQGARENLTPEELQSMGLIQEYAGTQTGSYPTFAAGENEIMSTLTGGYDPLDSPYYATMRKGIELNRSNAMARQNRGFQLGGNLSSLARARAGGELETTYDAAIAEQMLGLQERERQRKIDVLSPAFQYGQYVEEGPLRQAQALRQVGNVPRDLEQGAVSLGANVLSQYRPSYYFPSYAPTAQSSGGVGGALSGGAGGATAGSYFGVPGMVLGGLGGGLAGYFG